MLIGIKVYFNPKNEKELRGVLKLIHEKTKDGYSELNVTINENDNTCIVSITMDE